MVGSSSPPSVPDDAATIDAPRLDGDGSALAPVESARYVPLERVGIGGMGTVVRAYDRKLRREVALKRVRPEHLGQGAQARLVREARAMAQLSHPNVVAVYDVELEGDTVAIAMELVSGVTLNQWLTGDHDWRSILDAFVQAGAGLAAAHHAGMVHRDFKPSNVLVSDGFGVGREGLAGGQVKVTDFGLAKGAGSPTPTNASDSISSHESSAVADEALTKAGTVMGTPKYMAPEQHVGAGTSSASDQYAFCVALWEALTGSAPFTGHTSALTQAKLAGPPRWKRHETIPDRIGAILMRGLAPQPTERWCSIDALLLALRNDPWDRRRRQAFTAGSIIVGGLSLYALTIAGGRTEPCSSAEDLFERVWNQERRDRAARAMRDTGMTYARGSWERSVALLDAYGEGWVDKHRSVCLDHVHGDQSAEAMDLRMACLRRAKETFSSAVDRFEAADRGVVDNAVHVAASLPELTECDELERLRSEAPPPGRAELAAAVAAAERVLAESRSLVSAGDPETALEVLETLEGNPASEHVPFSVDFRIAAADIQSALGHWKRAAELLREALDDALAADLPRRAMRSARSLGYALGARLGRTDEGILLGQLAIDMARALPNGDSDVSDALISLGGSYYVQGRLDEAEEALAEALRIQEPLYDPGGVRMSLAMVLTGQGKLAEAERELRIAMEQRDEELGRAHPDAALIRVALAFNLDHQDRHAEAEPYLRESIEVFDATLGPDHIRGGQAHSNLGAVLHALGRFEEADAEFRRGIPTMAKGLGQDSPLIVGALSQHGALLRDMGRLAEAQTVLERAWSIAQDASVADGDAANSAFELARVLEARDTDRARELAEQALERIEDETAPPFVQFRAQVEAFLARTAAGNPTR